MVGIQFFKFKKRRNSTKVPAVGDAILGEQQCCFKRPTSMDNPVIVLAIDHGTVADDDELVRQVNYAKMFDQYYWVNRITSVNLNHWELELEIDPLATARSDIMNTNAFVMYWGGDNDQLIDTRLPRRTSGASNATKATLPFVQQVCYIMTAVSKVGVRNYLFTERSTIETIMNAYQNYEDNLKASIVKPVAQDTNKDYDESKPTNNIATAITSFCNKVISGFNTLGEILWGATVTTANVGRVMDNIKSVIALPFYVRDATAGSAEVTIGEFKTGINAPLISSNFTLEKEVTFSVLDNENGISPSWLRRNQFTRWRLYIPYIGCIELPSDLMYNGRNIKITFSLNVLSGAMTATVKLAAQDGGGEYYVGAYSAGVAVNLMMGSVNPDLMNVASNALSFAGNIGTAGMMLTNGAINAVGKGTIAVLGGGQFSGLALGGSDNSMNSGGTGAFRAAVAAGQNALNIANDLAAPIGSVIGGNSGGAILTADNMIVCMSATWRVSESDDPNTVKNVIGTPYFRKGRIGSMGGYVMCNGASVSTDMQPEEIDAINTYLNTGCFIE